MKEFFRTVKGFLSSGEFEPDQIVTHSEVAIRIGGEYLDFNRIEDKFKVRPSLYHRRGEKKGNKAFSDDMWLYNSCERISEVKPLKEHLNHINSIFLPHIGFLKELQQNGTVLLYCDYLTNLDSSGIKIPLECFNMYHKLDLPFEITFGYLD